MGAYFELVHTWKNELSGKYDRDSLGQALHDNSIYNVSTIFLIRTRWNYFEHGKWPLPTIP